MDNFDFKKYLAEGRIYQDLTENKLAQKLRDEAKHPDSKVGAAIFNKYAEKIENADKEDYKKIIKSMESELISKHPNTFSGEDDIPGSFLSEGGIYQDLTKKMADEPYLNQDIQKQFNMIVSRLKKVKSEEDLNFIYTDIVLLPKKITKIFFDKLIDMGLAEKVEDGKVALYYDDGLEEGASTDDKADMKKMKVSELKAKIKEQILAELSLSEAEEEDDREDDELSPEELANKYAGSPMREADEEVDVDIDVEDEVDVDVEADDIEIEKKGTDIKVEVGLSPEEELIQDSLKAAMDAANSLGNDKLADQIGNTITFFTREYVVGNR